jgi:CheY-like chemotaxis protein
MALHTLIVDDDPIILMIMKKMLERSDFHSSPLSFENGLTALNHLKENYIPNDRYVVMLDINMPVMNGWEFLEGLEDFADTTNTFVFVVSSSIDENDVQKANKNQFVLRYLSKPVYTDTLISLKEMLDIKREKADKDSA